MGYCEDVLLEKVVEGLNALATCYLELSSSTQQMCCPILERLLLLQCRYEDVLSEFSGYYCVRLLLDNESPLATFFIDLFHELEWLLETIWLTRARKSFSPELYHKICDLLGSIRPVANSCRYLFAISQNLSPTAPCSHEWLSFGKDQIKREGKVYRDFSMDDFRCLTKMISFVNLDQCSNDNKVKLGKKLGSGGYADVYEGHFLTRNRRFQSLQMTGEPVAVKVFRYGGDCTGGESIGSQFFDQMEKMVELQKMKTNGDTTSSMTAAGERLLSEELWKIVSAKHPNIVTARGYIGKRPPHGDSGLVMELMETSLQEHLEKVKEPLKELQMIDMMLEIAKGMRFLHECELVHKDLKPRNILLRSQKKLRGRSWEEYAGTAMEVKLADFGLTQYFVEDVQQSTAGWTTPAGTYCYMAPEVLHMSGDFKLACYQDKVDVFSYGTTCFNILTCEVDGALEFTCASSKASAAQFYEAVRSNAWRGGVEGKPEYLIDLIARCWDLDPSRRPTFAAICSLLQRAMLCILSPPVIRLANFQLEQHSKHNLMSLYRGIDQSVQDHRVIGTRMMESCLEEFSRDVLKSERGDMRSKMSEDATHFLEAWNKIGGSTAAARTEVEDVNGVSSSERLAADQETVSIKPSEAASGEELFDAIDDQDRSCLEEFSRDDDQGFRLFLRSRPRIDDQDFITFFRSCREEFSSSLKLQLAADQKTANDGANSFTTPVVRVLGVQNHSSKKIHIGCWRIPLKTMDPEWTVFKALVCNSMLDRFYYSIPTVTCHSFSPAKDKALSAVVQVDESLIPFLVCFWEGFNGPHPARSPR